MPGFEVRVLVDAVLAGETNQEIMDRLDCFDRDVELVRQILDGKTYDEIVSSRVGTLDRDGFDFYQKVVLKLRSSSFT